MLQMWSGQTNRIWKTAVSAVLLVFLLLGIGLLGARPAQATGGAIVVAAVKMQTNNPPVATDDSATTDEDTPATIGILVNDSDVDGDTLSIEAVGTPGSGGSVAISGSSIVYTPTLNFYGTETFTYTIGDGGLTASATVTMTVNAVNDGPTIAEGAAVTVTMSEDGSPTAFSLSLNGADVDGDSLGWSISTQAGNGTASVQASGSSVAVSYTPTADYHGSDSFIVQLSDGTDSVTTTVNVTIHAINDAPVAVDDQIVVVSERTTPLRVTANDSDSDGFGLVVTQVSTPGHGTVVAADKMITYTSSAAYTGIDHFTYTLDGGSQATVRVRVVQAQEAVSLDPAQTSTFTVDHAHNPASSSTTVEVPPGAVPEDVSLAFNETTFTGAAPPRFWFGGLYFTLDAYTGTEREEDFAFSQPITLTISYDPAVMRRTPKLLFWNGERWDNSGITFVEDDRQNHRLIVRIAHLTEFALFLDAPTAVDDAATTRAGDTLLIDVLANDSHSADLPLHLETAGRPDQGGAVTIYSASEIAYTPAAGFSGTETFTYTVSDEALIAEGRVSVTVEAAPNTAPMVVAPGDQQHQVGEAVALAIQASDGEANVLQYTATSLPIGLVIDAETGKITGTPTVPGTYPVTVWVSDGTEATEVTFTWTITPIETERVFYMPLVFHSRAIYTNDFEAGETEGWTSHQTSISPSGRRFLGEFSNETATLALSALPAHKRVSVTFDLYLIRSWDGNQVDVPADARAYEHLRAVAGTIGPDRFLVRTGEESLLDTTFSNWTKFPQSYPQPGSIGQSGAMEISSLGYVYAGRPLDSVYRITLEFAHTESTLGLDFTALGLQTPEDESWGIDNVVVRLR